MVKNDLLGRPAINAQVDAIVSEIPEGGLSNTWTRGRWHYGVHEMEIHEVAYMVPDS